MNKKELKEWLRQINLLKVRMELMESEFDHKELATAFDDAMFSMNELCNVCDDILSRAES